MPPKTVLFVIVLWFVGTFSQLPNVLNGPIHQCVSCVCHATTACYDLKQCAAVSIDYNYWRAAGAPRLRTADSINTDSYARCINNDNCIVYTVNEYVFGNNNETRRCAYTQEDDCRDMLYLHINKRWCTVLEPKYVTRFDNCATKALLPTITRDGTEI